MHWKLALLVLLLAGAWTGPATAQDEEESLEPRYASRNRRDPFVRHSTDDALRATECRGHGAESLRLRDVVLTGIVRMPGGPVALVTGPMGTTHFLRPGDRLCDGAVVSIDPATLTLAAPAAAAVVKRTLRPQ